MSRLLKITDLGSGIMVQGTDNVLFPDNATLTYPYNSIVVVTDDSDIATFRSASNNDVLFSGIIGSIQIGSDTVTKQNINAKFDAIANQESGGGGDVTGLFADASYDSQTKHINFYDKDNTLVAYVDATAFIKDGMVDSVAISNGNLVITFNTDAGKEPITIPLTDIFNPSNYYTKTDANALFATQVVVNEEIAARIAGDSALQTALGGKADKTDTYTKSQIDDALALKQDTISDLSTIRSGAALGATAYQKPNDGIPASDLASGVIPTVPTNVSAFTNDAGYLTQHQSLDNYYTKTQTDAALALKQDASTAFSGDYDDLTNKPDLSVYAESANLATVATTGDYDDLSNKPTIPVVPTNVSAFTNDAGYLTEHQSLANYYTKTESDNKYATIARLDVIEEVTSAALNDLDTNKQDVLTAGTNITIQNNVISATGGTQIQSDWNQSDSTAADFIKNKPDTSEFVTKAEYNPKEVAIAHALTDLNENKADKTDIPNLNNYYTKNETDTAISTAIGQIDLSDYQTKAAADVKEEVISTALNQIAANKVNNLGGVANIVKISASDYTALTTKDNNTLYIITSNV